MSRFLQSLTASIAAAALLSSGCDSRDADYGKSSPPAKVEALNTDSAEKPAAVDDGVTVQIKSWKATEELIASLKGKVVVVDLWSTSCEPCMREFPGLVKLHNKYGAEKIVCISVACDYEGLKEDPVESKLPDVRRFLKANKATFDNILLSDPSLDVWESIKLSAIPCVYVYGANGKQVKRFDNEAEFGDEGFTYKDHIAPLIDELITGGRQSASPALKPKSQPAKPAEKPAD